MTTGQAAAYLGVSVATLRRWCDNERIPHWRTPGGQRRFDERELRVWLTDRRKGHLRGKR